MGCSQQQDTAAATLVPKWSGTGRCTFVSHRPRMALDTLPGTKAPRMSLSLGSCFLTSFFFFLIHKINLYLKSSAAIICGGGNSAHSKALFNINEVISTVTNRQWGGGRCTNATIWLRKANIVTIIFSREQLPCNTSCFSDASSTGKRKNACIWHRSGRKPEFLLYRNFQYLKCFNCKWKLWVFPGNQDSWGFQDSEFAKYLASSQIISFSARQNQFHYH